MSKMIFPSVQSDPIRHPIKTSDPTSDRTFDLTSDPTSSPTSDPIQQSEIRPAISNWPALVWCKQHLFLLSHLWCSFPFWCPIVSPVVQLLSFLPLQRFLSSVNIHVWPLIEHWPINIYWTIWGQNSWTNKECALNLKCSIIINDNANNKTVS